MAMKRRKFLAVLTGFGTLVAALGFSLFEKIAPASMVKAVRTRLYPGKIIPIDEKSLKKPGKWVG
jgi:hypothetical protein